MIRPESDCVIADDFDLTGTKRFILINKIAMCERSSAERSNEIQ